MKFRVASWQLYSFYSNKII